MESERFDRLARSVGQPRSRRSLTRLLAGLGVAGVLAIAGPTETLAAKRNAGEPCTRKRQCLSRKCVGLKGQKACGCSAKSACPDGAQCLNGGCFRAESCAAECANGTCGPGFASCICSETVGGIPVCYANENYCTEGILCDADDDCPTGRACVDVSCVACPDPVSAVCLFPCPLTPA